MKDSKAILTTVIAAGSLLAGACADLSRRDGNAAAPAAAHVNFQLIRNATIKLDYAGTMFLVDPMLAEKEAYPGFPNTVNSERRFPRVELPVPVHEVLEADAVVLTHLHEDHWDAAARRLVPRVKPIFVQDEDDAAKVRAEGFSDVRVIGADGIEFRGTRLSPTGGLHGTDRMYSVAPIARRLGRTMGVVFERAAHPTVYVAGDTTWAAPVEDAISRFRPDVIVLNAGDAQIAGFEGSIIMGKDDVLRAHRARPEATIVAVHLEAVNHATLTRAQLREFVAQNRIAERVLIPADGERARFPR